MKFVRMMLGILEDFQKINIEWILLECFKAYPMFLYGDMKHGNAEPLPNAFPVVAAGNAARFHHLFDDEDSIQFAEQLDLKYGCTDDMLEEYRTFINIDWHHMDEKQRHEVVNMWIDIHEAVVGFHDCHHGRPEDPDRPYV